MRYNWKIPTNDAQPNFAIDFSSSCSTNQRMHPNKATFLDLKNDSAFKSIFGREENKDILILFLNNTGKIIACRLDEYPAMVDFNTFFCLNSS